MTAEIRVESWNELQDRLFEGAWNTELQRLRSPFAYRGLSTASYRLETTLMRLGGPFHEMEPHLLRAFRKYAHRGVVERDSIWNWLSVAKHHDLPVRLLDWTYSPFVALHFVTSNLQKTDVDGAVWAVNYAKVHERIPDTLRRALRHERADVFTVEMLAQSVQSLAELAGLAKEPFPVFFEPPSLDDRIVNQFAFFSMMSDPIVSLDDWLEARPDLWRKIIIPAGLKWEIRDRLDQANITERILFPGLDGLSQWLRRFYGPRV
jgi:hypothetical protein